MSNTSGVTFRPWSRRPEVAAMLEGPVRALLADADDAQAAADRAAILAELDRLDMVAAAQIEENRRRSLLRAAVEAEVTVPAVTGDICTRETRSGSAWHPTYAACGHKAKFRVLGAPRCGTHAKREIDNAVRDVVEKREQERRERGELTPAELTLRDDLILTRHGSEATR